MLEVNANYFLNLTRAFCVCFFFYMNFQRHRFPHPEINSLPRLWLKEIQYEIVHNGKQLCVTRRGAGIPCIVLVSRNTYK